MIKMIKVGSISTHSSENCSIFLDCGMSRVVRNFLDDQDGPHDSCWLLTHVTWKWGTWRFVLTEKNQMRFTKAAIFKSCRSARVTWSPTITTNLKNKNCTVWIIHSAESHALPEDDRQTALTVTVTVTGWKPATLRCWHLDFQVLTQSTSDPKKYINIDSGCGVCHGHTVGVIECPNLWCSWPGFKRQNPGSLARGFLRLSIYFFRNRWILPHSPDLSCSQRLICASTQLCHAACLPVYLCAFLCIYMS